MHRRLKEASTAQVKHIARANKPCRASECTATRRSWPLAHEPGGGLWRLCWARDAAQPTGSESALTPDQAPRTSAAWTDDEVYFGPTAPSLPSQLRPQQDALVFRPVRRAPRKGGSA